MDELVKSLRICADGEHCDQCAKWDIKQNGGRNACEYAICTEAADAIEKLSAKATPKRVGFAGWKGYRDTRYKCPYCKKNVRNDETYCHKCGQALMFPHISFSPYVPGEKQDVIVTWPDEPLKEE